MSAIAGVYGLNNQTIPPNLSIYLMESFSKFPANKSIKLENEKFFLGCHLQWITPESIHEILPYYDKNRGLAITADAIIDNREELFQILQIPKALKLGVTDSELILLAYQKWGEEAPMYLVGEYAFFIYDERNEKLFGARDFSGSRTLYYSTHSNIFAFATTIEALLSLPYMEKKLNEQWLAEFLAIAGMIDTVDASITPYLGVNQLAPSHSITVRKNKVSIRKYKSIEFNKKLKLNSDEEYIEAFQEIYQKSINSRLRTYRNVGAQLSGGLDSGSIVAFAGRQLKEESKILHTFSYIPSKDFEDFTPKNIMPDESSFIKSTVQYVGNIKDQYYSYEGRNPFSEIDDFLEIMEVPYKFFENSFWLKGMFEKAYEENVGVLLNGGRGNLTISWGSAVEYYSLLLKKFKWLKLYKELDAYSLKVGGARLRRIPSIAKRAFPLLNNLNKSYPTYTNPTLINTNFATKTNVFYKLKEFGMDETGWFASSNVFVQRKRHFYDDFHWNASNTLAAKLSLRYSLWKRDPTNDLRVVNFCLSLPEDQYVKNGMDRALIRRATNNLLPDKIRLNQKIRGVQGADWVHRMKPVWNSFLQELSVMVEDKDSMDYLNGSNIKRAVKNISLGVNADYILNPESKILMRSLIVHRFLKTFN